MVFSHPGVLIPEASLVSKHSGWAVWRRVTALSSRGSSLASDGAGDGADESAKMVEGIAWAGHCLALSHVLCSISVNILYLHNYFEAGPSLAFHYERLSRLLQSRPRRLQPRRQRCPCNRQDAQPNAQRDRGPQTKDHAQLSRHVSEGQIVDQEVPQSVAPFPSLPPARSPSAVYYAVGIVVIVIGALFIFYHDQIVLAIQPAANWMHRYVKKILCWRRLTIPRS